MFRFEFDPEKAASNYRKHNVTFDEAASVFSDLLSSTLDDDQHSWDERRQITVGKSDKQRVLFVVYTETDSVIRIIGARLADPTERKQYEESH